MPINFCRLSAEDPRPFLFAHRGACREAPENTLEAFALAEGIGVALECDVRGTADGRVVVLHDPTVDRTCDGAGEVRLLSLAEVRRLDAGARFVDRQGVHSFAGRGVRVPTLEELLAAHPGALINVDIHQSAPSIVGAVVGIIDASAAQREAEGGQVILTTQHTSVMAEIESHPLGCALGLCRSQVVEVLARSAYRRTLGGLGLQGICPIPDRLRGRALQIPDNAWEHVCSLLPSWLRPAMPQVAALAGCLLGRVRVGPDNLCLLSDAVRRFAHDAQMPVHVWEVDDAEQMQACFTLGATGLFTNEPRALARAKAAGRGQEQEHA